MFLEMPHFFPLVYSIFLIYKYIHFYKKVKYLSILIKSGETINTYRKGRRGEKKIAKLLRSRGFSNVRLSKGSRGPADIYAVKPRKRRVA